MQLFTRRLHEGFDYLLPQKFVMDSYFMEISWQNQVWTFSITTCMGSILGWMLVYKH